MANKHIVFVPGKNPKPRAAQHRELLWRTLLEGVRRADAHTAGMMLTHSEQFHLVSWNYLYYHKYKNITREIPWIDALIYKHGPTQQDILDASSWRIRIDRVVLNLVDHVPALIRFLPEDVRSTDKEIRHYFNNADNVAADIRKLLKHVLRPC